MRRRASGIIVLLIAVSLSSVTALLIRNAIEERRAGLELSRARARIQRFIAGERWFDAAEAIGEIGDSVRADSDDWPVLLRLARTIEIEGGVEQLFRDTARIAFEGHAEDDQLRAIYAIAQLREGEAAAAAETSAKLPDDEYAGVKAEAWLRSGVGEPPEGETAPALMVSAVRSPSARTLQRAWRATGDEEFGYNAMLYTLRDGDRTTAREISEQLPRREEFAEAMFVFLVERGDHDEAERWLALVPRHDQTASHILLTRADLALEMGDFETRRLLLRDAIDTDPGASSVPYLGLARMAEHGDDRLQWLVEGHDAFPGHSRIALDLASVYRDLDEPERAHSVLAEAHERSGSDDVRVAMGMIETDPDYSSERRRSARWELLSRYPDSEPLGGHLAAIAVRSGDREGLSLIVATEAGERAEWRESAQAVDAFAGGRTEDAIAVLEQKRNRLWYDEYNYGLLLLTRDRFGDAASAWERALEAADDAGEERRVLASIYLRSAETALVRRRYMEARENARMAVEHDPGSSRARMLLRFIGESG